MRRITWKVPGSGKYAGFSVPAIVVDLWIFATGFLSGTGIVTVDGVIPE